MSTSGELSLSGLQRTTGRALYADADGLLVRARGYRILSSRDGGASWSQVTRVPRSPLDLVANRSRMASRFLRHEVRAFVPVGSGGCVASTRTQLYWAPAGARSMRKARTDEAAQSPMSFCAGPSGQLVWGEYWANKEREAVRIFCSRDEGRSHQPVHRFAPGEIRHVHGLLHDPSLGRFWVFVGDHGSEPGIGLLDEDFSNFEWVRKGEQRFRAVSAFDLGDRLVYATDTEKEANSIHSLDKATGEIRKLADTDGSCIYACRTGDGFAVSTSAEPRDDASPQVASIWLSGDAERWERVVTYAKDRWSASLFQFGSIVLPRGHCADDTLMWSGQAVSGIDGALQVSRIGW